MYFLNDPECYPKGDEKGTNFLNCPARAIPSRVTCLVKRAFR